eukprot:TRINITY_DN5664_c0_g1_i2.p1 TRINITY_DN5664_c0_g1~~TRINITY_DN5664_c0_g1_i2.p1  ORF type:complete len:140 (+),score=10.35 TRINITY_DN5664_c0_g1_i2:791-1210(+)
MRSKVEASRCENVVNRHFFFFFINDTCSNLQCKNTIQSESTLPNCEHLVGSSFYTMTCSPALIDLYCFPLRVISPFVLILSIFFLVDVVFLRSSKKEVAKKKKKQNKTKKKNSMKNGNYIISESEAMSRKSVIFLGRCY